MAEAFSLVLLSQTLHLLLLGLRTNSFNMGLFQTATILVLGLSTCFATYGHNNGHNNGYHQHNEGNGGGHGKVHLDSPRIHLDSPKIHLDSAKILLDRPRIHVQDSHSIHDEDQHIYDSERPIYVRKANYGVHTSPAAVAPLIINGGYGGYGHGHGYGHSGKVLNVAGPVVVAPSPIVHDGPILIRRPVVVAKELSPTQDHLERLHYDRVSVNNGYHGHGGLISSHGHGELISAHGHGGLVSGHGHGGIVSYKGGLSDKAVVYDRAPLHSLGHGLISFSAYQSPLIVGQPRGIIRSHGHGGGGYISEKDIHGGGGYIKKY